MPRLLLAAAAVVILTAMTGCVDPAPPATLSPTPSTAPVFASEEEALAAAEAAYGAYVKLADQILMEGGSGAERLTAVATGEFLEAATAGYEQIQSEGLTGTGGTQFRDMTLQSYDPNGGPRSVLTVYVCEDITAVNVFDRSGESVVSPTRPNTTTFQAVFDLGSSNRLLISSREAWNNDQC